MPLSGLLPVLETPFHVDDSIDAVGFAAIIEEQKRSGADGVMFPGFASEFGKLSDGERSELQGVMLASTRDLASFAGIVSVPDHSTRLATRQVERAVEGGADAINILPPFALSPSPAEIVHHLDSLLDAAGETPVIVQLAPALTGSSISVEVLRELAGRHSNFATVKVESTPPGPVVTSLLSGTPALSSLVGYAGLHLIDALRRGAIGVQPGSSFLALYRKILDAWDAGDVDLAVERHERMLPYLSYWMQSMELIVQVEKTISWRRGLISTDRCRRPGRALDAEEFAAIDRFLLTFEDDL